MMRRWERFALLTLALSAMLIGPGSASAVEFHSDSSTGNTILTGESTGNHLFDAAGGTLTCKKATFTGTMSGNTAAAIKLDATYSECTFYGVPVTVAMNGCQFELNANGDVGIVNKTGKNCANEPMTFKAQFLGVSCDVKLGFQTELNGMSYDGTTTVSNGDVTVTPTITSVAYQGTGSGCFETGAKTNGNYTSGPTTLRGFTDSAGSENAQTPIWVA